MKAIFLPILMGLSAAGAAFAQTPPPSPPAPAAPAATVHRVIHHHTYTRHRVVTHRPSTGPVSVHHEEIKRTVKTPTGTHVVTENKTSTTPRQ
jgi:hypothetical protein